MFFKSSVTNMTAEHSQIAFNEFDVDRIYSKITSYSEKENIDTHNNRTEFTEFFWTFSIVLYSKKHDVSETGSVSVLTSSSSPEDGNRSSFRNFVFFGIQDDGKSPEKVCEFCTTYTIVRILSNLPIIITTLTELLRISNIVASNKMILT
jgi:hypothetical protein